MWEEEAHSLIEGVEDDAECIDTSYVGFGKMDPNDHPVSFADVVLLAFQPICRDMVFCLLHRVFPFRCSSPRYPNTSQKGRWVEKGQRILRDSSCTIKRQSVMEYDDTI